jgi:hypothetical protein
LAAVLLPPLVGIAGIRHCYSVFHNLVG